MEKDKGMELLSGIMVRNSKEIGNKELNVALVFGDLPKEIVIKVSGLTIGNMVKEFISIKIVPIKDNSNIFLNTDMDNKDSKMEIPI